DALTQLAAQEPVKAELVKLRYFAGLSIEEAAAVLSISPATAKRYWAVARAWLVAALSDSGRSGAEGFFRIREPYSTQNSHCLMSGSLQESSDGCYCGSGHIHMMNPARCEWSAFWRQLDVDARRRGPVPDLVFPY